MKVVYFKKLKGGDCLWAYTEDEGQHFHIGHNFLFSEARIFASRKELEAILKNEEITVEGKSE